MWRWLDPVRFTDAIEGRAGAERIQNTSRGPT